MWTGSRAIPPRSRPSRATPARPSPSDEGDLRDPVPGGVHHRRPLVLGGQELAPLDLLDSRCDRRECHPRGPDQHDDDPIVAR
jgi:hypothetical protein